MEVACTDEVKVYKDEGEEDEQKKSSENLTEDKVGLVIEGEGQCVQKGLLDWGFFSLFPSPFAQATGLAAAAAAAAATSGGGCYPPPWSSYYQQQQQQHQPSAHSPSFMHLASAAAASRIPSCEAFDPSRTTSYNNAPHPWSALMTQPALLQAAAAAAVAAASSSPSPRWPSSSCSSSVESSAGAKGCVERITSAEQSPSMAAAVMAAAAAALSPCATASSAATTAFQAASLAMSTSTHHQSSPETHAPISSLLASFADSAHSPFSSAPRCSITPSASTASDSFVMSSSANSSSMRNQQEQLTAAWCDRLATSMYAAAATANGNNISSSTSSSNRPTHHYPPTASSLSAVNKHLANPVSPSSWTSSYPSGECDMRTTDNKPDRSMLMSNCSPHVAAAAAAAAGVRFWSSLAVAAAGSGVNGHSTSCSTPSAPKSSYVAPSHQQPSPTNHRLALGIDQLIAPSPCSIKTETSLNPTHAQQNSSRRYHWSGRDNNTCPNNTDFNAHAIPQSMDLKYPPLPVNFPNYRIPNGLHHDSPTRPHTPPIASVGHNHSVTDPLRVNQRMNRPSGKSADSTSSNTSRGREKTSSSSSSSNRGNVSEAQAKRVHIKKPLNAFMLFMKDMRPRVQEECTLKESAAINQILGKKWHELARDKQAKYYEMARKEKELHHQQFPGWSARDNYAMHSRRKKKRKLAAAVVAAAACGSSVNSSLSSAGMRLAKIRTTSAFLPASSMSYTSGEHSQNNSNFESHSSFSHHHHHNQSECSATDDVSTGHLMGASTPNGCCSGASGTLLDFGNAKKCRARFGLEHQSRWCKPCRRKKKCIRFLTDAEFEDSNCPGSPSSQQSDRSHSRSGQSTTTPTCTISDNNSPPNLASHSGGGSSCPPCLSPQPPSTRQHTPAAPEMWSPCFMHNSTAGIGGSTASNPSSIRDLHVSDPLIDASLSSTDSCRQSVYSANDQSRLNSHAAFLSPVPTNMNNSKSNSNSHPHHDMPFLDRSPSTLCNSKRNKLSRSSTTFIDSLPCSSSPVTAIHQTLSTSNGTTASFFSSTLPDQPMPVAVQSRPASHANV